MPKPAPRPPVTARVALWLIRAASLLVPRAARSGWRREWEAEIDAHWRARRARGDWGPGPRADLLRRVLGALPDAAWIRRQLTFDADVVHDARHALRLLVRTPGVSAAAILILALGVGAAAAIFSVVDAVLLRPLPFPDPDRLVTLWETNPGAGLERAEVAPANFLDWRERATAFDELVGFEPYSVDLTGLGDPEVVPTTLVTEGFLEMLGVSPLIGRGFTPADHQAGSAPVALMTHGYWQRRFGGDPAIVGATLTLDGRAATIVGVLPPLDLGVLRSSRQLGLYVPKVLEDHDRVARAGGWWQVVGRLKHDIAIQRAQAELTGIGEALAAAYPRTNRGKGVVLVSLRETLVGGLRRTLLVLLGAVGLVLVIACVNVASLLVARGLDREVEFGLRAALGAGRRRLVAQLLTESLVLALLGCALGVALARWAVATVVVLTPNDVPRLAQSTVDGRVLIVAVAVATATALAFGLAPALQVSRSAVWDEVRAGRRGGASGLARRRARGALVATEVALAVVLLAGAGLLVRSFARLAAVDPGFRKENVLALQVFAWDRPETMAGFFERSLDRLRALPGVVSAGAVSAMPFIEANIDIQSTLLVEGRPVPPPGEEPRVHVTLASNGYFETMRIPLRRGRLIDRHDAGSTAPVAVISESLARRLWPADEPIGDRVTVRWDGRPRTAEIVGVVGQVRHDGLDRPPRDEIFLSHARNPFGSMTFVVRTAGDPTAAIDAATQAIWSVDPAQTIYDLATLDALVAGSMRDRRLLLGLLGGFAAVALLLTAIGVYAVTAFATRRRTHEIGVRMTLGARRADILALVVRQGLAPVAVGLAAGVAGALLLTRSLEGLLFQTAPADPVTLAAVVIGLAIVAAAACLAPALGATRIDPAMALKAE